jgi:hypothetical protein
MTEQRIHHKDTKDTKDTKGTTGTTERTERADTTANTQRADATDGTDVPEGTGTAEERDRANSLSNVLVEDLVVVEVKAVDRLESVHEAQVLTYLRLTGRWLGLLINFNTPLLKSGVKRLVHG